MQRKKSHHEAMIKCLERCFLVSAASCFLELQQAHNSWDGWNDLQIFISKPPFRRSAYISQFTEITSFFLKPNVMTTYKKPQGRPLWLVIHFTKSYRYLSFLQVSLSKLPSLKPVVKLSGCWLMHVSNHVWRLSPDWKFQTWVEKSWVAILPSDWLSGMTSRQQNVIGRNLTALHYIMFLSVEGPKTPLQPPVSHNTAASSLWPRFRFC